MTKLLRTLILLLALDLIWAAGAAAQAPARPNILVIMADDLGFSDIGPFGGEIETPALDALAREGRLMTSMHVAPLPDVAHAEFLFGVDHHQIVPRSPLGPMQRIRPATGPSLISIAGLLRSAGYATHMIGTWDSGGEDTLNPVAQGFDTSHALLSMAGDYFPPDGKHIPVSQVKSLYLDNGQPAPIPDRYITDFWTDRLMADILAGRGSGKPFFAYAAFTAPHFPLQAPDSFIAQYRGRYDLGYDATRFARIARQRAAGLFPQIFEPARPVAESMGFKRWESLSADERRYEARRMEVYAAMVSNLDWNIGRLVAMLKANGLYDNTLIVFTASSTGAQTVIPHLPDGGVDNGIDNIGRQHSWISYAERWAEVSNAPFSRWKGKGTEGGTVVPFIVHLPGQTSAQRPSDAMARLSDLARTLGDYAGARWDSAAPGHSARSLKSVWEGRAAAAWPPDQIFANEYRDEAYIRQGDWKAVRISDFAVNAYDGADRMVIAYSAALARGDLVEAEAIRANRPLQWKLFNIAMDRGETTDLAAQQPEILARLVTQYGEYSAQYGIPAER